MEKIICNFTEKKFYIFLVINATLWMFVESLRNIISSDSMEAIIWGNLVSFGTNKHPPLSGWLASGFYHLFFETNFSIYLLGTLCVAVGLVYIYKLSRFFMDEKKSICSSLILTTSFYYTFQVFYDNFNCNIISMALWPILSYFFYKSLKFNKIKHWTIFGIVAGLSFLAKYQVCFLFLGMFLYLIFCERKCFREKNIYVSFFVGILIILPHIIWLYKNDFFSLLYFVQRTQSIVEPSLIKDIFNRIILPTRFYLDQLLALLPCLVLYLFLVIKEKKVKFNNNKENLKDKLFILLIGLLPILIIGSTGFFTASRVVGAWGVTMVGYVGIILFYFFQINLEDKTYKFFLKWIISIMLVWQLSMVLFALIQTKIDMGFPYKKVMGDFNQIWNNKTQSELKYITGNVKYSFVFNLYNNQKPTMILETYKHKNPWVNSKDIINSGILIIGENQEDITNYTNATLDLFKINYTPEIHQYSFDIKNKFNNSKEYKFYYAIIPPQKNN